jgi:hypothetical protein
LYSTNTNASGMFVSRLTAVYASQAITPTSSLDGDRVRALPRALFGWNWRSTKDFSLGAYLSSLGKEFPHRIVATALLGPYLNALPARPPDELDL